MSCIILQDRQMRKEKRLEMTVSFFFFFLPHSSLYPDLLLSWTFPWQVKSGEAKGKKKVRNNRRLNISKISTKFNIKDDVILQCGSSIVCSLKDLQIHKRHQLFRAFHGWWLLIHEFCWSHRRAGEPMRRRQEHRLSMVHVAGDVSGYLMISVDTVSSGIQWVLESVHRWKTLNIEMVNRWRWNILERQLERPSILSWLDSAAFPEFVFNKLFNWF